MSNSKLESAAKWFEYAQSDLRASRTLAADGQHPIACFHAQQAVEKAFKGLLSITGEVKKVHSIAEMVKVVKDAGYSSGEDISSAAKLDRYYIATRYPDALPGSNANDVFDKHDANDAIAVAEQIIALLYEWGKIAGMNSITELPTG